MKKVAVIGSGGREHALVQRIHESRDNVKIYAIPGNPGTKNIAENIILNDTANGTIVEFCLENNVDLVIIGPEQPLVDGLADELRANEILVFGPDKDAAKIEGDKTFSKELMKKYKIPTAGFRAFNKNNKSECLNYLQKIKYPTVVKASGLAAGKGVLICENKNDAIEAVIDMFDNNLFGDSGHSIVVEEFMVGLEASIFAITDGNDYVILPASQDHKRVYDNDEGKNTGGMGAYAPAPLITEKLLERIENEIIVPTLDAMRKEGKPYNGCLYAGLMITEEGPKVVEFNCRFGDPETQVVLPIIEGDFLRLLESTARGKIDKSAIKHSGACAICVIASAPGYPDSYPKGLAISGIDGVSGKDNYIFQAGTIEKNGRILTNGGRVLGVTNVNRSGDLTLCKTKTYELIANINFDGLHYRTDISDKRDLVIK
jgi:phosphoribosylamine--glycine ligase